MNLFTQIRLPFVLVVVFTSLLLAGCVLPAPGAPSPSDAMPAQSDSAMSGMAEHDMGEMSFDQMFIDMMVPHHESAVAMAEIALERAEHPELKQLAEEIVAAQATEIEQMRTWREAWYGSSDTPTMQEMPMLHDMSGMQEPQTMDMAAEVELLREAPEPFDLAFIEAMIVHHQSAIDAARLAEMQATHPEIKELGANIIDSQQREIDQMNDWRESWQ
jgi:uncharacterized protein (DUF305 family)